VLRGCLYEGSLGHANDHEQVSCQSACQSSPGTVACAPVRGPTYRSTTGPGSLPAMCSRFGQPARRRHILLVGPADRARRMARPDPS
jgi:hypothetical protein